MSASVARRGAAVAGGLFLVSLLGIRAAPPATEGKPPDRLRRPAALAWAADGKTLYVANQHGGTVTAIDTARQRPAAEAAVGQAVADLVATPDGQHLLAVDEGKHELLLLSCRGPEVAVVARLAVNPYPVSVRVSGDGSLCSVLSLWSRRWTLVACTPPALRVVKTLDLPFAPRQQLLVQDDSKLIVADAFGGRLAVVDVGRGALDSVRELPAHNVRGLALDPSGKNLLVTHQHLSPLGHTTADDIHWGNLMTNSLRVLPLADVLRPDADLTSAGRLEQLGDIDRGAGDPAGVAVGPGGHVVVAVAGTNEVLSRTGAGAAWQRIAVGRRPTAVTLSPDGRRAYVANTFADSVSIVDLKAGKVTAEIALGPPAKLGPAGRGELLFHDAKLSLEGWLSCHSCHTDGHTNGRLNDNLGDGSFGAPKRVLSLRGVRDTGPYAWNGTLPDLAGQIRKSVQTTMHGRRLSDAQVRDLEAFLQTLPPVPGLGTLQGKADEAALERGRAVFRAHACDNCHVPPAYTSRKTYNVGLKDEMGETAFNPPSLRGVSQGGPYFHDNRAASLEEVFVRYKHQLKHELSRQDREDLLQFLRSL